MLRQEYWSIFWTWYKSWVTFSLQCCILQTNKKKKKTKCWNFQWDFSFLHPPRCCSFTCGSREKRRKCTSGGPCVLSHVADVIPSLLSSLSALEPGLLFSHEERGTLPVKKDSRVFLPFSLIYKWRLFTSLTGFLFSHDGAGVSSASELPAFFLQSENRVWDTSVSEYFWVFFCFCFLSRTRLHQETTPPHQGLWLWLMTNVNIAFNHAGVGIDFVAKRATLKSTTHESSGRLIYTVRAAQCPLSLHSPVARRRLSSRLPRRALITDPRRW